MKTFHGVKIEKEEYLKTPYIIRTLVNGEKFARMVGKSTPWRLVDDEAIKKLQEVTQ